MLHVDQALFKDLHKPRVESINMEIEYLLNDVIGCLRDIRSWTTPAKPTKGLINMLDELKVVSEPYGVVLIVGSWNYPLHVTMGPVAGAIAGGNCVVIKPSEISENTSRVLEQLLPKYIDPDCFKVYI